MIIQFVKFKSNMPQDEVMKVAKERAEEYRKMPGLKQKYYYKDNKTGEFGGMYFWESAEAMQQFLQSELFRSLPGAFGIIDQPRVEILDVVFTLRPEKQ